MKIDFLTWNTGLYLYGNANNYSFSEGRRILTKQLLLIHNFIDNSNLPIAVLQEIPYLNNTNWKIHGLFEMIKESFPSTNYDILFNKGRQIKMTVVISKKNMITPNINGINNNKFVSFIVKNTPLEILGVHSHDAYDLRVSLSTLPNYTPNIMIGDFNAGNYFKSKNDYKIAVNRENYLALLKGYIDVCQGKITTKYHTQIDHILLRNIDDFCVENTYDNIKVDDNITLSDHYPIYFSMNFSNNLDN